MGAGLRQVYPSPQAGPKAAVMPDPCEAIDMLFLEGSLRCGHDVLSTAMEE